MKIKIRSSSKITHQILLFYFFIFLITMTISLLIFGVTYNRVTSKKVAYATEQTINALNQNIENIISTVNGYSKLLLSNEMVQYAAECKTTLPPLFRGKVELEIANIVENFPVISSVHLYNLEANIINVNEHSENINYPTTARNTWWYKDISQLKGGAKIVSSGIAPNKRDANSIISHIRIVNSTRDFKPAGVLIINFDLSKLMDEPSHFLVQYQPQIVLRGTWGNMIFNSAQNKSWAEDVTRELFPNNIIHQRTVNYQDENYRISSMKNSNDIILSLITPIDKILGETVVLGIITIFLILLNGFLMYLGGVLISRLITTPLHSLVKVMKASESGILHTADVITRNRETGDLVKGYNKMVLEINKLIEMEIKGEKRKRQMELQVMQAQIKPHFLYNAFDAISSLALEGKNMEVYDAMIALGGFYNTSLNKGNEVITIGEEIETVKNYLNIQKIRYGELFTAEFKTDKNTLKTPVLKLILQPLVENAIYHGLKNKGECGIITITSKMAGDYIILSIEDDGIGMTDNKKREILNSAKNHDHENSFGLSVTIERLNLFYQNRNSIDIRDTLNGGTIIEIKIPMPGNFGVKYE